MDKLNETLLNGLDRYFNHLANFGKSTKNQQNTLLIFLHIKQIMEASMNIYINEEDYRILENALYCLFGKSCLLEYNSFKGGNSLFDNISLTNYLKLLEVNNIRFTENDDVRFQQM